MDARPLACDLSALTGAERARRSELAERFRSAGRRVVELPDGYALYADPGAMTPAEIDEWIALEGKCCPFLRFSVEERAPDAIVVHVTGDAGTKSTLGTLFGMDSHRT